MKPLTPPPSRSLSTSALIGANGHAARRFKVSGANGPPEFRAGYDAVETGSKARKQRASNLKSEDDTLLPHQRRKLTSDTRDMMRNFAVLAWAVRMHLAYVTSFTFQSRTGDKALDKDIEFLMRDWSRPQNCHTGNRHPLRRILRIAESLRTIDGDAFIVPQKDGRLQILEGDRVQNPTLGIGFPADKWKHGVEIDRSGKARRYAVCNRKDNGFVFDRFIPAEFAWQHGYFQREDQIRGVTPLSSAINPSTDAYEGLELARRRLKVAQYFGLKITRAGSGPIGPITDDEGNVEGESTYSVDLGGAPIFLDMKPGDDAAFLDNKTPSEEFQTFMEAEFRLIMATLDLPYTFFDVRKSTYSGARQDLLRYEKSAEDKIEDNQDLLDRITDWRLALWILDDVITLPLGFDTRTLRYEWVPSGTSWIDPMKEVLADAIAIATGIRSTPEVVKKRTGRDALDVLQEEKEYQKARKKARLPVGFPTQIQIINGAEEREPEEAAA